LALQKNQSGLPVPARLVCYWAVRELEMTAFPAARLLDITQSAVTKAVYRGEKLAKDRGFQMISAAKMNKCIPLLFHHKRKVKQR